MIIRLDPDDINILPGREQFRSILAHRELLRTIGTAIFNRRSIAGMPGIKSDTIRIIAE
jgi:hypothetical protein